MKYNYYFDIAAIILNIMLLLNIYVRRTYPTKTCTIYKSMLWLNLVACSSDLYSAFLISYPEDYSIKLNYFVDGMYLLFHNATAILFLLYVIVLIREEPSKREKIYITCAFSLEAIIIITNQFTNLVFYFDENLNYCHGVLIYALYAISLLTLVYSLVLFIKHRGVITNYQMTANIIFLILIICAVIFQYFVPKVLIESFCVTIAFFMMNVVLDNPEMYFYKNTYCFNQTAFNEKVAEKIKKNKSFTLLAIHFSDLKDLEKKYGEEEYDKAVYNIIETLQSNFEQKKLFFLLNECFVLRIENGKGANTASKVTKIFRNSFKKSKINSIELPHFAVLEYPGNYETVNDVNEAISSMIFDVYRENRNTIIYNDDSILEHKKREAYVIKNLRDAIANDKFEIYYQPIYDSKNDKYISCEALIRLKDDEGNFISPEEFIPISEGNGMILKIGDIVMNKVCKFIADNPLDKYNLAYVEINLSKEQLLDLDSVVRLVQATKKYNIKPSSINFEITETADLNDEERKILNDNIAYLYEKGFRFSLDDYGKGFSDIGYIAAMPFSIVKIDKSILWNAVENDRYRIVLASSIAFIKEMGIKCVVEGVENIDMVRILNELECDFFQGYLYSRPLDENSIIVFITKELEKRKNV